LCCDPFAYGGPLVAAREGLRWAALSTSLVPLTPVGWTCPYLEVLNGFVEERAQLLHHHGVSLDFRHAEAVSPWLNTVFATEALAGRPEDNPQVHAVGPSHPLGRRGDEPDFPWNELREGVPLVLASFGTQLSPPASVIEALAGALEAQEAQLVIGLHQLAEDTREASFPRNVLCRRYVPQQALLRRCAVAVSHGGANSIAECLTAGKPVLVIPLGYEQPLQAHLVTRAGVGRSMSPQDVTRDGLRRELLDLLSNPAHRARAEALGQSYRSADGAARAAQLLVQVASLGRA
jgi:zeaxanthin glucosyltransferase